MPDYFKMLPVCKDIHLKQYQIVEVIPIHKRMRKYTRANTNTQTDGNLVLSIISQFASSCAYNDINTDVDKLDEFTQQIKVIRTKIDEMEKQADQNRKLQTKLIERPPDYLCWKGHSRCR